MQTVIVYMTASDMDEARKVAEALISERLVACVNIWPAIESHFFWDDAVQHETEVAMIAKTKAILLPEVVEKVKQVHSYEVPCVVSLPLSGGNPDFLEWIVTETKD